ncbi:MAG TPA: cell division protein CrgA [Dermatophilaceae bacterium]|nr:cell division protein CrgA [Dermatophilaceae bacterium]
MPESRGRIRKGRARPSELAPAKGTKPNPAWYAPVMVGLMVLGLIWIVMVYLSSGRLPVAAWGNWNLAAGFGLIIVGFLMTTNWR